MKNLIYWHFIHPRYDKMMNSEKWLLKHWFHSRGRPISVMAYLSNGTSKTYIY